MKVSFDYDDTLTTDKGKELLRRRQQQGDEIYIITARRRSVEVIDFARQYGIKNIYFTDNGHDFYFEERVKLFDKSYFEKLAQECNLNILNTFGNYQLQEFDVATSPRLILVLQKK